MLGRKVSVVGEHSLLAATDFLEEPGVETGEQDWMNRYSAWVYVLYKITGKNSKKYVWYIHKCFVAEINEQQE